MGTTERREIQKQEIKKKILKAALNLFLKEGYNSVSIRRIAEKIEYSPATIYLHFKDKREIFLALQKMAFDKFFDTLNKCSTIKDPVSRLRKNGELYITFALENREFYDLMFIMNATIDLKASGGFIDMRGYDLLKQNIQACMESGVIKKNDSDTVALLLWSVTHGIASLVIRKRLARIPEKQIKIITMKVIEFIQSNLLVVDKNK